MITGLDKHIRAFTMTHIELFDYFNEAINTLKQPTNWCLPQFYSHGLRGLIGLQSGLLKFN